MRSTLAALALLALALTLPFQPKISEVKGGFVFEVTMSSTEAGHIQVYTDGGAGFHEADSVIVALAKTAGAVTYRLPLPFGRYQALRFDPIDRDGTIVIARARIVTDDGRTFRDLPLGSFKPINDIQSARRTAGGLELVVTPGTDDPQTLLAFSPPLALAPTRPPFLLRWLSVAAGTWLSLALLLGVGLTVPAVRRGLAAAVRACGGGTAPRAIAVVGALGVVLSCYPVVFCGRSFVSPNTGAFLLYDEFPTVPGYRETRAVDVMGSDVGALEWQQVPYSMIEARSLAEGELPVWNRYNSLGMPLLGQGQSMFGDPLHFLVIAADGAAWAWDLKFLVAKWLFAVALGFCVYAVSRHRGASLVVAFGASFLGFFIYRINHPAFFSFCYAPWILCAWLRLSQADRWRSAARWTALLVLANWAELCSGTVKEAYTLLLGLNAAGLLAAACSSGPRRARLLRAACGLLGCVLFAGLSCPVWATFFETLAHSWTTSGPRIAAQIQPSLFLGAFDEAFYRPLTRGNLVFNPSSNFLFLGGLLYWLASLPAMRNRATAVLAAAAVAAASVVFGFISPHWIAALPFIGNILHVDDCFSLVLIILTSVLAGAGFAAAAERLGGPAGRRDWITSAAYLAALVFAYVGFTHAAHRSVFGPGVTVSLYPLNQTLRVEPFIWEYLAALAAALMGLAWLARRALRQRRASPAVVIGFVLCGWLLVWREIQFTGGVSWPDYVVRPSVRVNFHARSPMVKLAQRLTAGQPSRIIGLQNNLFPGWSGVYGLEGINGPDALMNPDYVAFMNRSPLEHADWRYYLSRANLGASRPVLDSLNVRFYADLRSDQGALGAVLQLVRTGDLDLYRSRTAWPRAYFVARAGDAPAVAADAYRLTENSTAFSLRAPAPGLAVLTEAYWDGYPHAEVDGRPAAAVRVAPAFIGIPVSAGLHRVVVRYRPAAFGRFLAVAGASAVLFALGLFAAARSNRLLATSE